MRGRIILGVLLASSLVVAGCGRKPYWTESTGNRRPKAEERVNPSVRVRDVEPLSGDRMLAVADDMLSISRDGGKQWSRVAIWTGDEPMKARALARSKNGVHVVTDRGVFRSADEGETWASMGEGVGEPYDLFGTSESVWVARRRGAVAGLDVPRKLDAGVVTVMVELPSKSILAGSFGKGVFRSTDGGVTWTPSLQGLTTTEVTSLAPVKNEVLAGTYGGGVFRSSDQGATWTSSSEGLEDLEVQALASVGETRVLAGCRLGLFQSDDAGRAWKRVEGALGKDNVQVLAADAKGRAFAGTWGNGLYRSEDAGKTWSFTDVRAEPPTVTATSSNPKGPMYAGMLSGEVFRFTPEDGGWASHGKLDDSAVRFVVVAPDGKLFAATSRKLFFFEESRRAWKDVPVARPGIDLRGLVVNARGELITSTFTMAQDDQGIQMSSDMGASWAQVPGDLMRGVMPPDLAADPSGNRILQGCNRISEDGGRNWKVLDVPSGDVCRVAAGSKRTALVGSNNSSSAGVDVIGQDGVKRDMGSFDGNPRCVAVMADGAVALAVNTEVRMIAAGGSRPETRSTDRPGCKKLVGRDDGSLILLDAAGIHRSSDGGRTWKRVDGLQEAAAEVAGGAAR
jgi:photosystem II stability/assembly factor-like uncharacterized protein